MALKSVKVGTLDTIFSKCIRERAGWTCEYEKCKWCGNYDLSSGGLDNSHVYTRETRATRWFPDNCFALCRAQHRYFGKHPIEHRDFVLKMLGRSRYDDLVLRGNGHRKYTPHDRWEMNAHYKAQHVHLLRRRREGETSWLPLVSWD